MKRDVELFRKILLSIEESDQIGTWEDYSVDQDTFVGHVFLIEEAGLIEGIEIEDNPGPGESPNFYYMGWLRLTNAGHEFLNAVRDPTIWEKAKDTLKEAGRDVGTVTLSVLTALLIDIARKSLGLPPE